MLDFNIFFNLKRLKAILDKYLIINCCQEHNMIMIRNKKNIKTIHQLLSRQFILITK